MNAFGRTSTESSMTKIVHHNKAKTTKDDITAGIMKDVIRVVMREVVEELIKDNRKNVAENIVSNLIRSND